MTGRALSLLTLCAALVSGNVQQSDPLFREGAQCDYCIIAPNDPGILREIEPLATAKQEKGLKTQVVTVDSISASQTGRDLPEKIRNFLKAAYEQWGVTWVLLAGDYDRIPARFVSTSGLTYLRDTCTFLSDIYYSCLDGDWDCGADGVYGNDESWVSYHLECGYDEQGNYVCDSVEPQLVGLDLWHDIYIGRLPVSSAEETRIIVNKIMDYSRTPRPAGDPSKVLFFGTQLHYGWIDGDDASQYWHYDVKPVFEGPGSLLQAVGIDELYEDRILSDGRLVNDSIQITHENLSGYLSRGYNMVFFSCHGNPRGIRICSFLDPVPRDYDYRDVAALQAPSYTNVVSISCSVMKTAPDTNTCFAKSFLMNPNGGAVSYSGSSSADYFVEKRRHYLEAARLMASGGVTRIAKAFAIGGLRTDRQNRLVHQYWGDPEMQVWAKAVAPNDTFTITATKENDKYRIRLYPAEDSVLVCAYKPDRVFSRGYTRSGEIVLDASEGEVDNIVVTASHHDFLPSQAVVTVDGIVAARPASAAVEAFALRTQTYGGGVTFHFAGGVVRVEAQLVDVAGRVVARTTLESRGGAWAVPELARGIYVVRAQSGDTRLSERVVHGVNR
jgi:hypothetical protein